MKLTNEEVQEIVARADDEYDRLKDSVHEQYDEIKRLNNIINRTIKYVESLSSSGRGCDIYDDIKQEILRELKRDDK